MIRSDRTFPETFLAWEAASRDTIDFKKIYVDMADDLVAGLLLSQVVYWFLPDRNGNLKLRVRRREKNEQGQPVGKEHYWLAKKDGAWWDEIRVSAKQARRARKILEQKGIIVTRLYKFAGTPTTHIRINWPGFRRAWETALDQMLDAPVSEAPQGEDPCPESESQGQMDFNQRSKSDLPKGANEIQPMGTMESAQRALSITEITAQTLTENTAEITDSATQDTSCDGPQRGQYDSSTSTGALSECQEAFLAIFDRDRFKTRYQERQILEWAQEHGTRKTLQVAGWIAGKGVDMDAAFAAIRTALPTWQDHSQIPNVRQTSEPYSEYADSDYYTQGIAHATEHEHSSGRPNDTTETKERPLILPNTKLDAQQLWNKALAELRLQMTRATFDTWLSGSHVHQISDDGSVLTVGVRDEYAVEWLRTRWRTPIERTLRGVTGQPAQIEFVSPAVPSDTPSLQTMGTVQWTT